jgi:hypothetical protein
MTRKDYRLLAEALLASRPSFNEDLEARIQWRVTQQVIADALAKENPRFDRAVSLWLVVGRNRND